MTLSPAQQERAFQAVKTGNRDVLVGLLTEHPSMRNATNVEGTSLLLFSIYNQKKEFTELLVAAGAEFDVFSASAYGTLKETARIVEAKPALVHAYSPDGWTPLHLASFFGNIMVVEFLVASGADVSAISRNELRNQPLNAATASNKLDIAQYLLMKGADVHFAQHGGITPLHAAAHNGNEDLVRILLDHKANPAAKSDKSESPMEMAAQQGHLNVVSLLRSR